MISDVSNDFGDGGVEDFEVELDPLNVLLAGNGEIGRTDEIEDESLLDWTFARGTTVEKLSKGVGTLRDKYSSPKLEKELL